MKKITLFIIGIFCSLLLTAQTQGVVWQKLLGGTDTDAAHDIQKTSDDGFIIAGSSDSQDGDVGVGNGHYDFWIIKTDQDGGVQWKKTYGGTDWEWPNAIKPTSDGGYIVAGFTYSDDGDVSGFNGLRDGWIVKLNSSGDLEWQRCLGGSGPETARDVIETDGGYIVVGNDGGEANGDLTGMDCDRDFWIVKLDFTGTILWQQCYGGSDLDFPKKIKELPNSNPKKFIIVGYAESNDGDVSGHNGWRDKWVIAIDDSGNLLWQKALGGSEWEDANNFTFANNGNDIIVVGESYSSDGDVSQNFGDLDYWVTVLDLQGNLIMERSFGGSNEDKATSIVSHPSLTSFEDIVVSGVSISTDGDVEGSHGNGDFWILKLSTSNLEVIWKKALGGSGYEKPLGSVLTSSNNTYSTVLVGHTSSNDGDVSGSHGNDDLWIVNFGEVSVGINNINTLTTSLRLFPNPVQNSSIVRVEYSIPHAKRLIIRNGLGQLVSEKRINDKSNWTDISVKNWTPGIYFLEVQGVRSTQTGKLVISNDEN